MPFRSPIMIQERARFGAQASPFVRMLLLLLFAAGVLATECAAGVLAGWGGNTHGQLATIGSPGSSQPVELPQSGALAGKSVVAVASGGYHSVALCSDGTLAAWGDNSHGQLGNNSTVGSGIPVAVFRGGVLAGKTITSLVVGDRHTLVLCSDGTMAAWGENLNGQLGDGTMTTEAPYGKSAPVAVVRSGVLAGKTVVSVAAGDYHSVALCSDGTVATWGYNFNGQLGINSTTSSPVPAAVLQNDVLAGKTVIEVAAGGARCLARCSDGTLAAWGGNFSGQLGDGTRTTVLPYGKLVPVAVIQSGVLLGKAVTALAVGGSHCMALCSDGTVVAWGSNSEGQLGNNSTVMSTAPVAVFQGGVLSGKTVIALAAGESHSMVRCSDGTLASWGYNFNGQLGDGTTSTVGPYSKLVPVEVLRTGVLSGGVPAAIDLGRYHSLALISEPTWPAITALDPTAVTATSVVLNGTVKPNGLPTTAKFEYGLSTAYGSTAEVTLSPNNGVTAQPVSAGITGLTPGTLYYFRLVATNASGTSTTIHRSFTTPSNNPNLANLALSAGTLSPAFASTTTSYAATVSHTTTSITLTPTVSEPHATVTVNQLGVLSGSPTGAMNLAVGANTFTIVVIAQDRVATRSYTLVVTRTMPEIVVEQPAGSRLVDGSVIPLDIGTTPVEFTIRNAGTEPLTGLAVKVDGTGASAFSVTPPPSAPLAPGSSTTFTVAFAPGQVGVLNAALHVSSNDPDEPSFDIAVRGTGRPAVAGVLAFQNAEIDVHEGFVTIQVPVTRSSGSDGPVSVHVYSVPGTATHADYISVNGPVQFANLDAGPKYVPVTILADALNELNETFTLRLGAITGDATLGAQQVVTIRIVEADAKAPVVTVTAPRPGALLGLQPGESTTVTGVATDNKGVKQVRVSLNDGDFEDAVLTPVASAAPLNASFTHSVVPKTGVNTIRVMSVDYRGNTSTTITRSFTVLRPLAVAVDPPALGLVTAGFPPSSFREVGRSYTIAAKPKKGVIFTGWVLGGTDVANGGAAFTPQRLGVTPAALEKTTLTFVFREGLELTAGFMDNPYDPWVIGTYIGLVKTSSAVPAAGTAPGTRTEGYFTATVAATGAFSGKLTIDGRVQNIAGMFDHRGRARFGTARDETLVVTRADQSGLALRINIGGVSDSAAPAGKIVGQVSVTQAMGSTLELVSNLSADRAPYTGLAGATVPDAYLTVTGVAPSPAGRTDGIFTVVLPSVSWESQPDRIQDALLEVDYPTGDGVGTLRVTKAGAVTLATTLADGTAVTAAGKLTQDLRVALFAQLYGAKGFLSTELQLDATQTGSDVSEAEGSEALWSRPFMGTSHYYPYGWPETLELDVLGARYLAVTGQSVLTVAPGTIPQPADAQRTVTLTFSNGALGGTLVKSANLTQADLVTKVPVNDPTFTMVVNRPAGIITGVFDHTDDTTPAYRAVILQKGPDAGAYGFFLTNQPVPTDYTGLSGKVEVITEP